MCDGDGCQLDEVVAKLTEQLKKQQKAANDFQQQYNIRTVDPVWPDLDHCVVCCLSSPRIERSPLVG